MSLPGHAVHAEPAASTVLALLAVDVAAVAAAHAPGGGWLDTGGGAGTGGTLPHDAGGGNENVAVVRTVAELAAAAAVHVLWQRSEHYLGSVLSECHRCQRSCQLDLT